MSSATMTSKGQITIPKDVREGLHADKGSKIEFRKQGNGYFIYVDEKKAPSFTALSINTTQYIFDREEANER